MGFFGNMFDLNGDGKLDCSEQALEFMFLSELMKDGEKKEEEDDGCGIWDDDEEDCGEDDEDD